MQNTRELTEKEKDQYRIGKLPDTKHGDILRQQFKKNKVLLRYLDLRPRNNWEVFRVTQVIQRNYRVQRRKYIIKDDTNASISSFHQLDKDLVKTFLEGSKHIKDVKIAREQMMYSDNVLKHWIKILKHTPFKRVKTVAFTVSSWRVLEALQGKFQLLNRQFTHVEDFTIIFKSLHGISDNYSFQDYTYRLIRRLNLLKSLRIEFKDNGFVQDKHLNLVTKTLRHRLEPLESLGLVFEDLRQNQVTPKAIENLWKSLDGLPNLKKLDLIGNFGPKPTWLDDAPNFINQENFATLCNVLERKASTLLDLYIDTGLTNLDCDSHRQFCKAIANMLPRLHSLGLGFFSRSMQDESLGIFGHLLGKGSDSLKTLELGICSQTLTVQGAKIFADRLKKGRFPNLEKLTIRFKETFIFDGLYDIVQAITVAFPNVKKLDFFFPVTHTKETRGVQQKATALLKEKLKNLPSNFELQWK